MAFGLFGKKKEADTGAGNGDGAGAGGPGSGVDAGGDDSEFTPNPSKAQVFFDRAKTVGETGNHEYSTTLWLQGLRMDPTSMSGHEEFLKAAAAYAADTKAKGPSKDQAAQFAGRGALDRYLSALLNWGVRQLDWQLGLRAMEAAAKIGLNEPAYWIGTRVLGIAGSDPKAKKGHFVQIMELFSSVGGFDRAVLAGEVASRLDPSDARLVAEVRNMSAQATMNKGGYEKTGQAGGFRANVRDIEAQRLREQESSVVKTEDAQTRLINAARSDYESRPSDVSAIQKYAKLLMERGTPEDEKVAFNVLMKGFETTQSYRFKQLAGDIKLRVARRRTRELKEELERDPANAEKKEALARHERQLLEAEIKEYEERVAAYPTDMELRFHLGKRYLESGSLEQAIEQLQQARESPAIATQSLEALAQAFRRLEWLDEAETTYRDAIQRHDIPGDDLATDLRYGLMETLEKKAQDSRSLPAAEEALKLASSIAIQKITYRDIRTRRQSLQELVKSLRPATA